jgi:hypothetical protein
MKNGKRKRREMKTKEDKGHMREIRKVGSVNKYEKGRVRPNKDVKLSEGRSLKAVVTDFLF